MLGMLAGLEPISGGDVLFDGQRVNDTPAAERRAAMVFQSYALYPHLTGAENMGFSLGLSGRSKAERAATVGEGADTRARTASQGRPPPHTPGPPAARAHRSQAKDPSRGTGRGW